VLVNLINNAQKFSYPNSEVNLRIYKEEVNFSVSDNGIGFNHNQTESYF
jgi:signal transduction histidine kinase